VPKILIIDDDRTMVYLLKTLLEMDGFEVAEAKNWDAILETVSIEKPDIVLMDYFLPNMDGLDIISQIRATPDLAETRIVMSSGMDVSDQCLAVGADAFLQKPYDPEELVEILQKDIGEDAIDDEASSPKKVR
jgi:CheY-like chemotaxis protein